MPTVRLQDHMNFNSITETPQGSSADLSQLFDYVKWSGFPLDRLAFRQLIDFSSTETKTSAKITCIPVDIGSA